jgi:ABC-2 type transport system permease protein
MNIIGLKTLISQEIKRFTRVWIQSLVSPWINALLYILIFGVVVGSKIESIAGVSYIDFVLPGIVMMNLIGAAYMQGAFGLYFKRFGKHIEELLVAPFSHFEMLLAFVVASVARGLMVGLGVYVIALFFTAATIVNLGLFIFYSVAVSLIFACIGLIVGMWADNFEHLSVLQTFVITPLIFLGGVFNSITMLPEKAQIFVKFNPFFYFVDGLRYSMVGIREGSAMIGFIVIFGLILGFGGLSWYLFKIGWRMRT